jgi:hypothetical protein
VSDFSDRPFVAGSVIGLRAFSVDKYGRLVGPSQKTVFMPGDNEAECRASKSLLSGIPTDATVTMSQSWTGLPSAIQVEVEGKSCYFNDVNDVAKAYPPKRLEHATGALSCGCGFYAYFDGRNDYLLSGAGSVAALIEGFGVTSVGDRGFRSSKARLVALITPANLRENPVPEPEPKRRLIARVFGSWITWLVLALGNVASATAACLTHHWLSAGVSTIWALSIGVQGSLSIREIRRSRDVSPYSIREIRAVSEVTREQWERVRLAYPDVPIYGTQREAMAAHPLTPPALPTPDDPEFWTRSAS